MSCKKVRVLHGVVFTLVIGIIGSLVYTSPRVSRSKLKDQLNRFKVAMTFKPFNNRDNLNESLDIIRYDSCKYINSESRVDNLKLKQIKESKMKKTYKVLYTLKTDGLPNESNSFEVEVSK